MAVNNKFARRSGVLI